MELGGASRLNAARVRIKSTSCSAECDGESQRDRSRRRRANGCSHRRRQATRQRPRPRRRDPRLNAVGRCDLAGTFWGAAGWQQAQVLVAHASDVFRSAEVFASTTVAARLRCYRIRLRCFAAAIVFFAPVGNSRMPDRVRPPPRPGWPQTASSRCVVRSGVAFGFLRVGNRRQESLGDPANGSWLFFGGKLVASCQIAFRRRRTRQYPYATGE